MITHKKNIDFDILMLDAENRQSLVTVRSLGKKGLRVAALANMIANAPAFVSKWCLKSCTSPAPEGSAGYQKYLLQFLKQNQTAVIIPSSDGTIELLRKYRKQFASYTSLALASEKALDLSVNKLHTLRIARQLGIAVPQSVEIHKGSEIAGALRLVGLPAVMKPTISWTQTDKGSKRVAPVLVTSLADAEKVFADMTEYGGTVLLQQYLTGKREAISFIYADKTIYAKFAQWAKRTQPPIGGTSVLRESIRMPKDIGEQAEKLIRAIDLEGYSEVEFRRDTNNKPYLMEINPRLSASVELAVHAGVDFPMLLYLFAAKKLHKPAKKYRTGIWERYLAGDVINMTQSIGEQKTMTQRLKIIGSFLISFLQPMHYDYVDMHDMLPAWSATSDLVVRNIKKIFIK